jgi:hypothetical protein
MSGLPMPGVPEVRDLLGMLFDGIKVKTGSKLDLSPNSNAYSGVYVSDSKQTVALCACDFGFAARSGAALSMLPPNAVQEALKSKQLGPAMLDNLREVMNICARLMLREGSPHLKLDQVYAVAALPPAASALIGSARNRIDFEIELGKYGSGTVAVLAE